VPSGDVRPELQLRPIVRAKDGGRPDPPPFDRTRESMNIASKQDVAPMRGAFSWRIESTGPSPGASGGFKWTIAAGRRRLILEGVGGWCDGLVGC
jgi:hypothetical protein